jgi:putative dimethyl sulfoxide reductase chaperone
METAALAEIAKRRSSTYWLLSRLVLEAPSSGFLADIGGALDAARPDVGLPLGLETLAFADAIRRAGAECGGSEALSVERTRLLGGLARGYGAPPPYESVFREDKLPGESTIAVSAAYAEAGFDPPVPEAGPADHLGAELRFLSLACYREMEAWQAGDRAAAAGWVERERAFLDEHVLQWVPEHCERLAQIAETPFYRAAVSLIGRACLVDREDVTLLLDHTAT